MIIFFPKTPRDRIDYVVRMYKKLNPELDVTSKTTIKNTTIEELCKFDGGPYQRIKKWLEGKLEEKPVLQTIREVKFSGTKDEYIDGATRDSREGKGRYDLISPLFLKRLALVLEAGAKNHGDNNWKGGIKYSRLIDSSLRHISQFHQGMRDEDHIVQAVCNLMFLVHFEEEKREELNDLIKPIN